LLGGCIFLLFLGPLGIIVLGFELAATALLAAPALIYSFRQGKRKAHLLSTAYGVIAGFLWFLVVRAQATVEWSQEGGVITGLVVTVSYMAAGAYIGTAVGACVLGSPARRTCALGGLAICTCWLVYELITASGDAQPDHFATLSRLANWLLDAPLRPAIYLSPLGLLGAAIGGMYE
jgi:hypothetical protein